MPGEASSGSTLLCYLSVVENYLYPALPAHSTSSLPAVFDDCNSKPPPSSLRFYLRSTPAPAAPASCFLFLYPASETALKPAPRRSPGRIRADAGPEVTARENNAR